MTGDEIRLHAEYHIERGSISQEFALKFINECLIMDIGKDAKVIDNATINAAKDTWVALPSGCLEVFEIEKDGAIYYGKQYGSFYYGTFDIKDGYIKFPRDGEYTIYYYRRPNMLSIINDTPEVDSIFHYAISLYVASRYKAKDEEDNPDADRLMGEYQIYKQHAINQLAKMKPTTKAPRRVRTSRWT